MFAIFWRRFTTCLLHGLCIVATIHDQLPLIVRTLVVPYQRCTVVSLLADLHGRAGLRNELVDEWADGAFPHQQGRRRFAYPDFGIL